MIRVLMLVKFSLIGSIVISLLGVTCFRVNRGVGLIHISIDEELLNVVL